MDELNTRIAIVIAYLQDQLGGATAGKRLSMESLATVLNNEAGQIRPFKKSQLYSFKNGIYKPGPAQQSEWVRVILALCKKQNLPVTSLDHLPETLIKQYGSGVSQSLISQPEFVGDHIDDPDIFSGAWRFFYVSPVDREGSPKPEIRGVLAIFSKDKDSANRITVRMISGSTLWTGFAFAYEWHLYIFCTAKLKTETAFFIVNKPSRSQSNFVAGLGSALERGGAQQVHMHPAMGVLCFGEKCHGRFLSKRPQTKTELTPEVVNCLDRLIDGEAISDAEEKVVRGEFKATYPNLKRFSQTHPELSEYLDKHIQINQHPYSIKSLLLEWR